MMARVLSFLRLIPSIGSMTKTALRIGLRHSRDGCQKYSHGYWRASRMRQNSLYSRRLIDRPQKSCYNADVLLAGHPAAVVQTPEMVPVTGHNKDRTMEEELRGVKV